MPDNPRLLRPTSKPTTMTLTNIRLLAENGSFLITESGSFLVLEQQELRLGTPLALMSPLSDPFWSL